MKPTTLTATIISAAIMALCLYDHPQASVTGTGTITTPVQTLTLDGWMGKITGTVADSRLVVTNGTTGESLRQTPVVVDGTGNVSGVGALTAGYVAVTGQAVVAANLDVQGELAQYRVLAFRVNGDTTLAEDQSGAVVLADTSALPLTITLPQQPVNGTKFTITQVDGAANTVTVTAQTPDVLDSGGLAVTFPARAAGPSTFSWTIVYDAVADNWVVIGGRE